MIVTVSDRDPRPIYRQIVDEMRRAIATGSLAAEDPLPSIRRLAVELRLNPNTVKQAYRELEHQGLVYVRRGQGTFVSAVRERPAERERLLAEVARRALADSRRHGFELDEVIGALRSEARQIEADEEISRGETG